MASDSGGGPAATDGTTSTGLKRKSTDIGWEYGHLCDPKDLNAVRCNFCKNTYEGGINRLKRHIAHVGKDVAKCQVAPDEAKKRCLEALEATKRSKVNKTLAEAELVDQICHSIKQQQQHQESLYIDADNVVQQETLPPSPSKLIRKLGPIDRYATKNISVDKLFERNLRQASAKEFLDKGRLNDVHLHVSNWMYEAGIPFNAIAHPSFHAMADAIAAYGKGYRGPSRYQLSEPLLKKAVDRTKESLKQHELEWKETGCSIMTDSWSDRKRRSIMNLCVNSRLGTMFLSSREESIEAHTAEYIANYVSKCVDDIGNEKVVQVVTDNASNNMAAAKNVLEKRQKLFWTSCATHTINLMLEGISKLTLCTETISKAKNLTIFIYAHHRTLAMMRKFTKKRDIVRPGVTRFATSFLTLQSLYNQKSKLRLMFSSDDWSACKLFSSSKGKQAYAIVLSHSFWQGVRTCLDVFAPLVKVLRLVDGDNKPTMGFVFGELEKAKKEIQALYKNKEKTWMTILNIIIEKGEGRIDTSLHKAAYFLNPYYFYNNMEEIDSFNMATLECIEKFFKDDIETMTLVQNIELAKYRNREGWFGKIGAILGAQVEMDKFDPVEWWTNWGNDAPNLKRMAKRILALTSSASGCERNWSTFEGVHTKKRNRLEASRLNDLVYVQFNAKLLYKKRRLKGNGDVLVANDTVNAQGWMVENGDLDLGEEDDYVPRRGMDLRWSEVGEALGADSFLEPRRSNRFVPPPIRELNEDLDESSSDDEPAAPQEDFPDSDEDEDRALDIDTNLEVDEDFEFENEIDEL